MILQFKFSNGAYLSEIDKFDYEFFNITPKEASLMSSDQRIFYKLYGVRLKMLVMGEMNYMEAILEFMLDMRQTHHMIIKDILSFLKKSTCPWR